MFVGVSNIMTKPDLGGNALSFNHAESPRTVNANIEVDFCHECLYHCFRLGSLMDSCKNFKCHCHRQFDEEYYQ